ncbi:MAG TPA: hypothetical protein VJL58_06810, partial [Pyrinomonadaceae bacterium]|nr:hypothetical protein [Pyrinomonadaceae bacterium]
MKNKILRSLFFIGFFVLFIGSAEAVWYLGGSLRSTSSVTPTVFIVDSDGDGDNNLLNCMDVGGLPCTLRRAIHQANDIGGNVEIRFNIPNCSGICVINLTSQLPEIYTNISIVGPGPDGLVVRRSTVENYRIFFVAASTTATISGMT